MEIYILYVNQYSLKFSCKGDDLRVTTPNFGSEMKLSGKKLSDELVTHLKALSWTKKAIAALQNILFDPTVWKKCDLGKFDMKKGIVYKD